MNVLCVINKSHEGPIRSYIYAKYVTSGPVAMGKFISSDFLSHHVLISLGMFLGIKCEK